MCENDKKKCALKYFGLFCATLIGAFLAVYVVADITISRLFDPFGMMKNMSKMEDMAFKDFDKDMDMPMMPPPPKFFHEMMKPATVDFVRLPDAYKFIVDLKDFSNKSQNVNVAVKEDTITISGENKKSGKHSQSFSKFSQSYLLDDDAEFNKMSKKTVHDKYIITVPIEDD